MSAASHDLLHLAVGLQLVLQQQTHYAIHAEGKCCSIKWSVC